jgi:hypothetical protein
MSEDALRKIALQVRNWDKWGPEDELGTLNYITSGRIAPARRLSTTGKVFALGIAPPLPVTRAVGTPINPYALK